MKVTGTCELSLASLNAMEAASSMPLSSVKSTLRAAPHPPQAIVFDCDGLLLETESLWTKAEVVLFAQYGRQFTPEHKRALIGTSQAHVRTTLAKLLGQPGRGAQLLEELYISVEQEFSEVVPMPGAVEIIQRAAGVVPIALASNSPRRLVSRALVSSGLVDAFDSVITADDVADHKPHPAPYLASCAALNIAPIESVALEDSSPGVASAKAAGMFVIGVPSLVGVDLDAHLVASTLADSAVTATLFPS